MSHDELSTKQDCLISDRAFWFGLVIYVLLFIAVAGAFAISGAGNYANVNQTANGTGTLVFGPRDRLETDDADRADLFHDHYGALTFHRHRRNGFSPSLNWSAGSMSSFDPLVSKVGELPVRISGDNRTTFLRASDPEITPMQIALGVQNSFIGEEVTANPEPATWFAAVLVAGAVAWSQRRRLPRNFWRERIFRWSWGLSFLVLVSATAGLLGAEPGNGNSDSLDQRFPGNINPFDSMAAIQSPGALTTVNLSRHQNITVSGAPGQTVVLSLKDFIMTGMSTFTLQGTATTMFVINVNQQFSLSGSARIVLAGGVVWNHVVFNVRGTGSDVRLTDHSSLTGILNAPKRTVRMNEQAIVYGQVNAKKVLLGEDSQIIPQPVVSPEQPPPP